MVENIQSLNYMEQQHCNNKAFAAKFVWLCFPNICTVTWAPLKQLFGNDKSKSRPRAEMENETAIRDLEAQIDLINAAIQDLSDKRRSLQTQRNSKLPFFNLPAEICVVIFSFACHKGRLPQGWNRELVTTPLVISSVCRAWRDMARSAPGLWSSVSLYIEPSTEGSAIQAELLDQWLRLAQTLPLSITITPKGKDAEGGVIHRTRLPTDVISVAASYSHQWESLDTPLPSAWATTLGSTTGRIPILRSLSLQSVPYKGASFSPFSETFLDAPKLCTVALESDRMNVGLPYHQLEKLTIWPSKTTPYLAVLKKCSSLTFCRINSLQDPDSNTAYIHWQPAQPTSVQLSKLVSLEIISFRPSEFLAYLVAPALEDIVVALKEVSEVEVFSTFLNRSNTVLKRLTIIGYMPQEEHLLMMLDTLPHLSHLELRLSGAGRYLAPSRALSWKFFDYLRSPNTTSGTFPLPCLKSFIYHIDFEIRDHLKDGENDGFDIDTLEKTLLTRWNAHLSSNGVSQLQTFCMSISRRYVSSKVVADMERSPVVKDLIKEGMDLVFKSQY